MSYQAAVIGAGPGGLACVSALLDAKIGKILWVDRDFNGGRLNSHYREISSNTKVGIYLDGVSASPVCQDIIKGARRPNPVSELEGIDRDKTCDLALAADMVLMLRDGLLERKEVDPRKGAVRSAVYDQEKSEWALTLDGSDTVQAERLILATGSDPMPADFHSKFNKDLTVLDLDECMVRSKLPALIPATSPTSSPVNYTIGIIGNSHSGILVMRNLYDIAHEHDIPIRIINFQREPIRYAEYRDDGIVFDNTGLKGDTATWSHEHLDDPDEATAKMIEQVELKGDEDAIYQKWIPQCTHMVYAIGYKPSPLPKLALRRNGKEERIDEKLDFDMHSSGFHLKEEKEGQKDGEKQGERVPALYGCGIAFPEETTDPEGHVEPAVGMAKFFKFTERVKDNWVKRE